MNKEAKIDGYHLEIDLVLEPKNPVEGETTVMHPKIKNIGDNTYPGGKILSLSIRPPEKPGIYFNNILIPEIEAGKSTTLEFKRFKPMWAGLYHVEIWMEHKKKDPYISLAHSDSLGRHALPRSVSTKGDYIFQGFGISVDTTFQHWQKEVMKESKSLADSSAKMAWAVIMLTILLLGFEFARYFIDYVIESRDPLDILLPDGTLFWSIPFHFLYFMHGLIIMMLLYFLIKLINPYKRWGRK